MKFAHIIGLLALLIALSLQPLAAQKQPLWQAAEAIRAALFDAQKALLLQDTDAAQTQVADAHRTFDESLSDVFLSTAPDAHALITAQLEAAEVAAQANDASGLALARGQVWTGLLWGGYQGTMQAVTRNEPEAAGDWLLLREFRQTTRFSRPDADASLAVEALSQGDLSADEAVARVRADLLDTYQARLNQDLSAASDAAIQEYTIRQAEHIGLAYGHWRILQPAYEAQLGAEANQQAETAFSQLLAAAYADAAVVAPLVDTVTTKLRYFRAAPLSEAEQQRRAGQLLRFLSLVSIEYDRGVHDGQIVLDFEIQEAVTFLEGALAAFEDVRLPLEARNTDQTAQVEMLLQSLHTDVQAANRKERVAPVATIRDNVNEATTLLTEVMPDDWLNLNANADFDVLATVLDQVMAAVENGQYDMAESARLEAYAIFDLGPEPRLLALRPQMVAQIDGLFWQGYDGQIGLAQAIAVEAPPADIKETRAILDDALTEAQRILGDRPSAPFAIALNAAVIVFREGLEAVVIMVALLASLVGAYKNYRRPMLVGVVLAFIATVITWIIAQQILLAFSRFGERLEAVVSLIAIGVLLLITNWFFHNIYWTDWLARFHRQKKDLLAAGTTGQFLGLMALGFSSVYREGFETVLFLQALVLDAGNWVVLQGVGMGLLGVLVVGYLTFQLQTRLPYKSMLVLTGVLICGVLVIMVGNTAHILQVVNWLSFTPIRGVEVPYWMGLWLGIYPTWEAVGLQLGALAFVVGSYYLAEFQHHRTRTRRTVDASTAG